MNQEDQIRNEKLEEVKQNKFAAEGIKESMVEELGEGAGTDLQKKLSQEKDRFVAKYAINKNQADAIENIKMGANQTVVQLPTKRTRMSSDTDLDESLLKSKKGQKRPKKSHK